MYVCMYVCMYTIEEYFQAKSTSRLDGPLANTPWPNELTPPPPSQLPYMEEFTGDELEAVLKKLPTRKSPGPDGVRYEDLRNMSCEQLQELTNIMNFWLLNRRIPHEWKIALVTLLLKTDEHNRLKDRTSLDNWRPISHLNVSYKVFMKLITNRLLPWIISTERLSPKQKGGLPTNGLQQHVFCLKTIFEDFKHSSMELHSVFIDFADAFGSIEHDVMLQSLEDIGTPQLYCDIIKDVYTDSQFQVKCKTGLTNTIKREKGIVQGGPWSMYQFVIGIDPWVRWLNYPNSPTSHPNAVQAYVDDVEANATTANVMEKTWKRRQYSSTMPK